MQMCVCVLGFNSFLATLATSAPINIFAQNNGIISFTLCASRVAGVCAGAWLIIFGVLGKVWMPMCAAAKRSRVGNANPSRSYKHVSAMQWRQSAVTRLAPLVQC